MSERDNGGPAFPMAPDVSGHWSGMTLRDWFAGQALAGMLTNPDDLHGAADAAKIAYAMADAMLEARE